MLTLKDIKKAVSDKKSKAYSPLSDLERNIGQIEQFVNQSTSRFDTPQRKPQMKKKTQDLSTPYKTQQYKKQSPITRGKRMEKEESKPKFDITQDRFDFADKILKPKIMTKQALRAVTQGKSKIVGMVGCGACKIQKNIIDGKVRIVKINDEGKAVYDFVEFNKASVEINKNLQLNEQLRAKKINSKQYEENKQALLHQLNVTNMILDHKEDYLKSISNYEMLYVNGVNEEEVKPFQNIIEKFEKNQSKIDNKKNELLKLLQKHQIPEKTFVQEMQKLRTEGINAKENLLDTIQQSSNPNAKKVYDTLIANELADVYGLTAYPMKITSKCEIKPENHKKLMNNMLLGKTEGLLSDCQDSGYKEGMDFITWDAKQRNDTSLIESLTKQQKSNRGIPHAKKNNNVYDLDELMNKLA